MSAVSALFNAVRVAAPGPASVLAVAKLPALVPTASEVLLRVLAIGVNPVETYIRSGTYGKPLSEFPYTPGNDCAGIVAEIGPGVTKFKPGDRVYTIKTKTGAYAEYALADEKMVRPAPASLTDAEVAAIPTPFYTAYRTLFHRLNVRPGRTILVHGATGAVGVPALQMAKAHGLTVIGSAGTADGAAAIAPHCHTVVMHGDGVKTVESVLAATGGAGVHYVAEMLGNVNLAWDLKMLRKGGAVCVVGSRGEVTITPRDIMRAEATVTGVMLYHATDEEFDETAAYIAAHVDAGVLKPLVGSVHVGLEAAPAAHEEVIDHKAGAKGKVVITVP